jgi:hypothetical protein
VTTRKLNAFTLAFFLALGLVIQGALPAHGCSCMPPDPFGGLAAADGAFVGTLAQVDRGVGPIANSGDLIDFRFEVEATLKGDIGDAILVKSASDGAACGIEMPVGERAGFLLTLVDGEWHGNLCATVDADALLAAANGLPEPVEGSPPHLIVFTQMGDAGLIALDRQGQIVGYGEGLPPWMVSTCPDDETFIGTASDTRVQVWSFTNLALVGEYQVDTDVAPWVNHLVCLGPGGNPFLATTVLSGIEQSALVRHADGVTELLAEDIEILLDTAVGPVAIGSDGTLFRVETGSGELVQLVESVGDLKGQIASTALSPDGTHLALSAVNWNETPPAGRVIVFDLESGEHAETVFACDIYPAWLDNEQISLWDTCNSTVGGVYTNDLELIREEPAPNYAGYGWTVTDETGAVFYPSESGVSVIEPGSDTATPFGQLTGFPTTALLVPEETRAAWEGSAFVPGSAVDGPVPTFEVPEPGEFPPAPDTADPPAWLMAVGAVVVGGVLWLLVRRPTDHDLADEGGG